jgi:hypothetical protein
LLTVPPKNPVVNEAGIATWPAPDAAAEPAGGVQSRAGVVRLANRELAVAPDFTWFPAANFVS